MFLSLYLIVWIHILRWNNAQSLMLLRRGALLFFKAIRRISRSHGWLRKSSILTHSGRFRTVTPVWIHQWLCNDAQVLKLQKERSLFKVTQDKKIANFYQNWPFPDCNSSLNIPMALKCCTKLNVVSKRCPVLFQGHPSNFNSRGTIKFRIFTWIVGFPTVTPVWIHRWIWSDAQSLM